MRARWILVAAASAAIAGGTAAAGPSLDVSSPLDDTVARPVVHLEATCDAGGGAPCATITLVEQVNDCEVHTPLMRWSLASHVVFDVAIDDGAFADLELHATDANGDATVVTRRVYGDTSPALHELASVDGPIYDADETRVLYEAGGESWILDRAACTRTHAGSGHAEALTPHGALTAICANGTCALTELRAGATIGHGPFDPSSLRVAGAYAVWTEGYVPGPLHRLDLETGDDLVIASDATPESAAVGADGTVTYSRVSDGGHVAYRWTPAGEMALGPGDLSATDGTLAVFNDDDAPACVTRLYADGEATTLSPLCTSPAYLATVRSGRVAYLMPDESGARQLWLRDRSGAPTQLTTTGVDLAPPLADDGSVLARTAGALTLIVPGVEPRAITKSDPVVMRDANGRWLIALGRTLFTLDGGDAASACGAPSPAPATRTQIPASNASPDAGAAGCSATDAHASWLVVALLALSRAPRRTRARDRRADRSRPRCRPTAG